MAWSYEDSKARAEALRQQEDWRALQAKVSRLEAVVSYLLTRVRALERERGQPEKD